MKGFSAMAWDNDEDYEYLVKLLKRDGTPHKKDDYKQFAWEFIRRNEEYKRYWEYLYSHRKVHKNPNGYTYYIADFDVDVRGKDFDPICGLPLHFSWWEDRELSMDDYCVPSCVNKWGLKYFPNPNVKIPRKLEFSNGFGFRLNPTDRPVGKDYVSTRIHPKNDYYQLGNREHHTEDLLNRLFETFTLYRLLDHLPYLKDENDNLFPQHKYSMDVAAPYRKISERNDGGMPSIPPRSMIVGIDLMQPIQPQIDKIQEVALYAQKKEKLLKQRSPNCYYYILYIRMLDAIAEGATRKDIMKTLTLQNVHGQHFHDEWDTNNHLNKFKGNMQKARDMRDGGYRLLSGLALYGEKAVFKK
jgi:hypothetical protein